jgi:hypothetical protein
MNRTLSNTVAVLVLTLFVALAIIATVHLAGSATSIASGTAVATAGESSSVSSPTGYTPARHGNRAADPGASASDTSASSSSQLLVCPSTGCAAPTCHGAH